MRSKTGKTYKGVPLSFEVRPLRPKEIAKAKDACRCLTCGRYWDDGIVTGWTPTPSARCPFENWHVYRHWRGYALAKTLDGWECEDYKSRTLRGLKQAISKGMRVLDAAVRARRRMNDPYSDLEAVFDALKDLGGIETEVDGTRIVELKLR